MAQIISGAALADTVCANVAPRVADLRRRHRVETTLAVVVVGQHPPSEAYVGRKVARCREVGIRSIEYRPPATTSQADLLSLIDELNRDHSVHGILVQLPLPPHLKAEPVLAAISPEKDVDGFHPTNAGRLSIGDPRAMVPCTALGCVMLLETAIDDFAGLKAVVIGKSNIVGKPTALLLLARECTVTMCHIKTRNLPDIVRGGDIVVVAAGAPGLVRGDWVKPGAVVIDVGITRVTAADGSFRVVGDACFDELDHAAYITPVPGGVGPMTVACLMHNTVSCAERRIAGNSGVAG
jgi:methylenetetrahydrofolate dehydrogenase (NADP+) / methenyltetrahydrofolate cyclohydrolase